MHKKMKAIGLGAQYRVFDTQNGRVRKIPLSRNESLEVVRSWYLPNEAPSEELAIDYPKQATQAYNRIERLLGEHPEISYSFGNPAFEDEGVFTQDKLLLYGKAIHAASAQRAQQLIYAYADLIVFHWRYGISELSFNCAVNCGVDKEGRVVLLDFGETTFYQQDARSRIESKRWLEAASYKNIPSEHKDYYRHLLHKRLTMHELNISWGTAL